MSRPCCHIARGMGARFCGACGRAAENGRRSRLEVHEEALGLTCLSVAALGLLGIFPLIDVVVPVQAAVIADEIATDSSWEPEPGATHDPVALIDLPASGDGNAAETAPDQEPPTTEEVVSQLVEDWSGGGEGSAQPGGPTGPLVFTRATASAFTAAGASRIGASLRYAPDNAVDGDRTTGWQVSDGGVGHWLRLELPVSSRIERLGFVVGYDKVATDRIGDRWPLNNRVSDVLITWEGGSSIHHFEDDRATQWVDLSGVTTSWVNIEITGTYPGSRWNDTVISEVQCEGAELLVR